MRDYSVKIADQLKQKLIFREIDYEFVEAQGIFHFRYGGGEVLPQHDYLILVGVNDLTLYACLSARVEEKRRPIVGEFLHRANYGLRAGNFELDYKDGEIRYKYHVDLSDENLSDEIFNKALLLPVVMIRRYEGGLIAVMLFDCMSAEEAVEIIENKTDEVEDDDEEDEEEYDEEEDDEYDEEDEED